MVLGIIKMCYLSRKFREIFQIFNCHFVPPRRCVYVALSVTILNNLNAQRTYLRNSPEMLFKSLSEGMIVKSIVDILIRLQQCSLYKYFFNTVITCLIFLEQKQQQLPSQCVIMVCKQKQITHSFLEKKNPPLLKSEYMCR